MVYDGSADSKNVAMTEEGIVSKVRELLETLDHVKKYNMLARALKKFALLVLGSIIVFVFAGAFVEFLYRNAVVGRDASFIMLSLLLLVPLIGFISGLVFVRQKINSVGAGKWQEELSQGFPSALKILMKLNWEKTIDEISIAKLSYALYGLLKTLAYGAIIFFIMELGGNVLVILLLGSTSLFLVLFFGAFSLLVVISVLAKDLLRRYKEIESLNMLLLELRWFSLELRRVEFKT